MFPLLKKPASIVLAGLLLSTLPATVTSAAGPAATSAEPRVTVVKPDDANLLVSGRVQRDGARQLTVGWSGARVGLRFEGSAVTADIADEKGENYVLVWVDGQPRQKLRLNAAGGRYVLASDLGAGVHTVEVVRVTEGFLGLTHFRGFEITGNAVVHPWPAPARRILFIGDSITCGYGVEVNDAKLPFTPETENFCESYTGLTVRALGADYLVVSRSGIGMLRNYDGPRDGNPDAMPAVYPHLFFQVDKPLWQPEQFVPAVICINLGTNDHSTKGVNEEKFVAAYLEFARQRLTEYPHAKLVLLQGPMDNSEALRHALEQVQAGLDAQFPGRVHRFTLSAQGELGFGASYHPNRAQSRRNADELIAYLRKLMSW
jgi:lysophospholipase L1-like esterase